jgi:archaellum component FlaC
MHKPFERGGLDQATLRAEVEALRDEVERLHGLVSEARNWIDPDEHEAWEEQAKAEASSCSRTIDRLRAEVERLKAALRDCMGYVDVDNITMQYKQKMWLAVLNGGDWQPGNLEVRDE